MGKVCFSTYLLGSICMVDLSTTVVLLRFGGAAEANPLMARFLAHGVCAFVGAKLVFILLPICILEWARRRRPLFVLRAVAFGIAAYLMLYTVGVSRANWMSYAADSGDDHVRQELWAKTARRIAQIRALAQTAGRDR